VSGPWVTGPRPGRSRTTLYLVSGLGAAVVVLCLVIAVLLHRTGTGADPAGASPTRPGTTGPAPSAPPPTGTATTDPYTEPTSAITPDPSYVAPYNMIELAKSTASRNGYPAGFGHDQIGAVTTAVHEASSINGWDCKEIANRVTAYHRADGANRLINRMCSEAREKRAHYGLSTDGVLPPGASDIYTVIGVDWTTPEKDVAQVSLLVMESLTVPGQAPVTSLASNQSRMVWADGDWRMSDYTQDQTNPYQEPAVYGSQAYNDQNWVAIKDQYRE
jgi:hypothetical protein